MQTAHAYNLIERSGKPHGKNSYRQQLPIREAFHSNLPPSIHKRPVVPRYLWDEQGLCSLENATRDYDRLQNAAET